MNPFRFLKFKYWRFKDWQNEKHWKRQRAKRGYADVDVWNLHYWLTETFPKMIYDLRDSKHGAPELEFEEFEQFPLLWVEEQSKILMEQKRKKGVFKDDYKDKTWDENEEHLDFWGKEKIFDRWWMVLSRIAWCLEQASEENEILNEYEDAYNEAVWGKTKEERQNESFDKFWKDHWEVESTDKKGKPLMYRLVTNEPPEELKKRFRDREDEIAKYKDDCKNEAMDLIKKYFWNLWD